MSTALQQRRAELAAKQEAERKALDARRRERESAAECAESVGATDMSRQSTNPPQAAQHASANGNLSLAASSGDRPAAIGLVKPVGVATKSAVPPRGGARQGALGPFLARLRAAQD